MKMKSLTIGAALTLVIFSRPAFAQRHGRPDGVQKYARAIPAATLSIRVFGLTSRLRQRDLLLYPETLGAITNQRGMAHSIAGVLISALPGLSDWPDSDEVLEVHYGFFHVKRIRLAELAPGTLPILVTTLDNRAIGPDSMFYLLIRTQSGEVLRIQRVTQIKRLSQQPPP